MRRRSTILLGLVITVPSKKNTKMSEEIVNLSEALRTDSAEDEEVALDGAPDKDKDKWKALRQLLKMELLNGEIPVEPSAMKPKQVWQKYKDASHPDIQFVDYVDKSTREKYTRMLRSLRKKHKDGDLENEEKTGKQIVWAKSAAKQYLKQCFRDELISVHYDNAEEVWKNMCQDHAAFARMSFDAAFVRRLSSVQDDYVKKVDRCQKDLEAYLIAKENHPTPEFNCRGEPQWNGSDAQKLLKDMVSKGEHEGKEPKVIWQSKEEFQLYSLQTFRDHIYQEERLIKFNNYLGMLKKRKLDQLQY